MRGPGAIASAANIGAGGGGAPYVAQAVHFDGSAQLVSSAPLAGISTPSRGILSVWWKTAETGSDFRFLATNAGYNFELDWPFDPNLVAQDMILNLNDADFTNQFSFFPNTSFLYPLSGWMNLLIAWDTNFPAGQKLFECAVNGALIDHSVLTVNDAHDAFDVDYSGIFTAFGNAADGYIPKGDVVDFYFAPGQYLDLTDPAKIAKFVEADGKPVFLGSDGSIPTGTAPAIFFSGDASSFATNKGTGGAFTPTGSLTNASTSPSD
ncbi:hypothetical protein C8D77_101211 [Mesorhizobium loti]|uniref:Uncharacterized protein n=1 Tax=Rhizobium loti TaxID=381 RepID=A0A8E3B6X3_RHILI|nr:hypothetical protein [Mesorhizobium loti]PWJ93532.1 hypothetical protein C8D77_101211 [Mesorhizobium loti]